MLKDEIPYPEQLSMAGQCDWWTFFADFSQERNSQSCNVILLQVLLHNSIVKFIMK